MTSSAPLLTDTETDVSFRLFDALVSSMPWASNTSLSGVETTGGPTSSVNPPPPGAIAQRERDAVGLEEPSIWGIAGRVGAFARAPEAALPDRVVGVAALGLDPDVRSDRRDGEEADLRARVRHAGHRPAEAPVAQDGGHADLDPRQGWHGSRLLATLPRYLPKMAHGITAGAVEPCPRGSARTTACTLPA